MGLEKYDELERIGWEWQSVDGYMIKASLARESVGLNPKSIESRKTIQKLMEQQRKMDTLQNKLRKYPATVYADKVKGVMDNETFAQLSNQFKECDQQEEAQQKIQA